VRARAGRRAARRRRAGGRWRPAGPRAPPPAPEVDQQRSATRGGGRLVERAQQIAHRRLRRDPASCAARRPRRAGRRGPSARRLRPGAAAPSARSRAAGPRSAARCRAARAGRLRPRRRSRAAASCRARRRPPAAGHAPRRPAPRSWRPRARRSPDCARAVPSRACGRRDHAAAHRQASHPMGPRRAHALTRSASAPRLAETGASRQLPGYGSAKSRAIRLVRGGRVPRTLLREQRRPIGDAADGQRGPTYPVGRPVSDSGRVSQGRAIVPVDRPLCASAGPATPPRGDRQRRGPACGPPPTFSGPADWRTTSCLVLHVTCAAARRMPVAAARRA
jgi:hypothetical protein